MNVIVKQACQIKGVRFPKGAHTLTKEIARHEHTKFFMKAGYIVEAGKDAPAPQESPFERSQRLAAKIKAEADAKKAATKEAEPESYFGEMKDEDESDFTDSEDLDEGDLIEEKSTAKKKVKRRK